MSCLGANDFIHWPVETISFIENIISEINCRVQRQMNDLEIKCLYKNTLPNFKIEIDNIVLDKSTMDTADGGTVE